MSYYADDFGYGDEVYDIYETYDGDRYDEDHADLADLEDEVDDLEDTPSLDMDQFIGRYDRDWAAEPDVDHYQEQNDFAHDDDFQYEDQHLDGMYEE